MKRILVYHTPGHGGGTFRYVNDPSDDEVRRGREEGAFLIRRVVEKKGNRVYGAWVTDEGLQLVVWETDVSSDSC